MENYQGLIHDQRIKATSFRLIKRFDEFELRKYTTSTILEVIENGSRAIALSKAKNKFKNQNELNKSILINESSSNRGIPEVMIEPSTKINQWKFEFFLENHGPSFNDLPKEFQVEILPEKTYGTIKINALMSNEKIVQKILLLKSWLAKEKCSIVGKPKIAIYKSPWKIAFLRKMEIYIEVEPIDKKS